MKHIILFTDCLGAGGAQRQLVGLAIMLKEIGYNVKVCTYQNFDFYKKQLDDAGVPNELIPGADNTKKRILAVRNYFKQELPDWVIAYQETPSLVACAAKILGCKFKLIVSERNTTQTIGLNERVRFFLYRWSNRIVPNSFSQEKFLKEHYPWMDSKLKTITNFVDLEHFNYVERTRRDIPEIVVAATIWEPKNTLGFIDSVKQAVDNGGKFHVSWYGKSELNIEYFNQCQLKINEYGLGQYIELKNKTKQIREVYRNASLFCLPSFYEGTPNVLCEAISTGLPIICSKVCDNAIYVHTGINGFLFNPYDTSDMASKIMEAINMKEMAYMKHQKNSRSIALDKLSREKFLSSYVEIIES